MRVTISLATAVIAYLKPNTLLEKASLKAGLHLALTDQSMAPLCLNCVVLLEQETPGIEIGVSDNIGNYIKCTVDVRQAMRMGAPKIRETLQFLCERTTGLDHEVSKALKEIYRSVIVPNREWGTLYRRKRDDRGHWVLDTLWVELGGVQFPTITLPDALSYILGATLDLKEDEGMEGGTMTAAAIIFATWIERLSPAAYPNRVGACWIQGSCFLFNPKDASHAFGSTLPSQQDEKKRQAEYRYYDETRKIRKAWLDHVYKLPTSAPVMEKRSRESMQPAQAVNQAEVEVPEAMAVEKKETEMDRRTMVKVVEKEATVKKVEGRQATTKESRTAHGSVRFVKGNRMSLQDFFKAK